jgi:hypothetical protein
VPKPSREDGAILKLSANPGSVYSAEEKSVEACLFTLRFLIAQDCFSAEAPEVLSSRRRSSGSVLFLQGCPSWYMG